MTTFHSNKMNWLTMTNTFICHWHVFLFFSSLLSQSTEHYWCNQLKPMRNDLDWVREKTTIINNATWLICAFSKITYQWNISQKNDQYWLEKSSSMTKLWAIFLLHINYHWFSHVNDSEIRSDKTIDYKDSSILSFFCHFFSLDQL